MISKKNKNSWRKWWTFYRARLQEYIFMLSWVLLFWAWETYVEQYFPLHGTPRVMLTTFEYFTIVATTWELFILVFQIPDRGVKNLFSYFANLLQPPHRQPFFSSDKNAFVKASDIIPALV